VRLALAVAFAIAATPALAAGDADSGRALAQRWCRGCHGASDAVPPLAEAVNRPGRTPGTLQAWLADPHPPMPNLSLTRAEIADLVAYLETLRKGN
jgi:mono/diheme cytochrome c family protein